MSHVDPDAGAVLEAPVALVPADMLDPLDVLVGRSRGVERPVEQVLEVDAQTLLVALDLQQVVNQFVSTSVRQ